MNKDNNTAVQSGSLNNRETWGSRIGYIFSTLGMAVGVGALWRFPMMTGQYGGGAFVIAVIIITGVLGNMIAETVIKLARIEEPLWEESTGKVNLTSWGNWQANGEKASAIFCPSSLSDFWPIIPLSSQ